MKRVIMSASDAMTIESVIPIILRSKQGRTLYNRLCNMPANLIKGYLGGVLDTMEVVNKTLPGFDMLHELVITQGADNVQQQLISAKGAPSSGKWITNVHELDNIATTILDELRDDSLIKQSCDMRKSPKVKVLKGSSSIKVTFYPNQWTESGKLIPHHKEFSKEESVQIQQAINSMLRSIPDAVQVSKLEPVFDDYDRIGLKVEFKVKNI